MKNARTRTSNSCYPFGNLKPRNGTAKRNDTERGEPGGTAGGRMPWGTPPPHFRDAKRQDQDMYYSFLVYDLPIHAAHIIYIISSMSRKPSNPASCFFLFSNSSSPSNSKTPEKLSRTMPFFTLMIGDFNCEGLIPISTKREREI